MVDIPNMYAPMTARPPSSNDENVCSEAAVENSSITTSRKKIATKIATSSVAETPAINIAKMKWLRAIDAGMIDTT